MGLLFKEFCNPAFNTAILKVSQFKIEKETEELKNYTAKEKIELARSLKKLKSEQELYDEKLAELQKDYKESFEQALEDKQKIAINEKFTKGQTDLGNVESSLEMSLDFNKVSCMPEITPFDLMILEPLFSAECLKQVA